MIFTFIGSRTTFILFSSRMSSTTNSCNNCNWILPDDKAPFQEMIFYRDLFNFDASGFEMFLAEAIFGRDLCENEIRDKILLSSCNRNFVEWSCCSRKMRYRWGGFYIERSARARAAPTLMSIKTRKGEATRISIKRGFADRYTVRRVRN